jgi:hypothetical protein
MAGQSGDKELWMTGSKTRVSAVSPYVLELQAAHRGQTMDAVWTFGLGDLSVDVRRSADD